jgi:hypothetical protein
MWKVVSVYLEIVLISMQDRCTVCTEHTIGSKIILGTTMVLLGDVDQVETRFGPRFVPNVPWVWQSFLAHPMELLGDVGEMEGRFGLFGDSVNLDA